MVATLITISGADCAGKSTQIARIVAELESTGPVTVLWYRPGYSQELDALRRLVRRASPGTLPPPGRSARRYQVFRKGWMRRLWLSVAVLDTVVQLAIKLRWKRRGQTWVVCDRYVGDTVIDLSLRFPDLVRPDGWLATALWVVCPKSAHALLLMIPEGEQLRRIELKQEPFPDPEDVRRRRAEMYRELAAGGRVEIIDAAQPVDAVFRDIAAHLEIAEVLQKSDCEHC